MRFFTGAHGGRGGTDRGGRDARQASFQLVVFNDNNGVGALQLSDQGAGRGEITGVLRGGPLESGEGFISPRGFRLSRRDLTFRGGDLGR